jgi:glycosyltransferase involved in cell wall biosynthesis
MPPTSSWGRPSAERLLPAPWSIGLQRGVVPPDVTVIVPTYRRPRKTSRAIRSALRQQCVSLEVVAVDDASPEPFELPPDLVSSGVRVVRRARNGGAGAARNTGVQESAAPFIAFLDSDDLLVPDTLAHRLALARAMASDGRPALLAGAVWRWRPKHWAEWVRPIESDRIADLVSGCWFFPGSTSLLSRATWELVGGFDERLRRLEDLDWATRLGLHGGCVRVAPDPVAVIERSQRAGYRNVSAAARMLAERYRAGGEHALGGDDLARLRAYLALERASSALGEGRWGRFGAEMLGSLIRRPRRSLHQNRWWTTRSGSAAELAWIESLAAALDSPTVRRDSAASKQVPGAHGTR